MNVADKVLWSPPDDWRTTTPIGRYLEWLSRRSPSLTFDSYDDVWRWSVSNLSAFWQSIWEYFELGEPVAIDRVLINAEMPGAQWFPDVALNYSELALRGADADVAIVSSSQSRLDVQLTYAELREQVALARAGLQRIGVGRGDRVAAYLPNIAETIVAFLATASLGAVWSSCAPEFGTSSVVARFAQIDPSVLLVIDGYRYGNKSVDRRDEVDAIRAALPNLRATVLLSYLDRECDRAGTISWDDFLKRDDVDAVAPLEFDAVPFDHPLYVLYSSGTTGVPKPIVHAHGAIAIEHVKALALHHGLNATDRLLWFTTTGWMMWNYAVSTLLLGGTVVCFDGDPAFPAIDNLFELASEHRVTSLGTSPAYVGAVRTAGCSPGDSYDLSALRSIAASGAPMSADLACWFSSTTNPDAMLVVISGGTDVCSAFIGPVPMLAVVAGEMACRYLGAAVESWSADGNALVGEQGELVITAPLPSMPIGFWGDEDGLRYRRAYFDRYPGVWHHGDWITIASDGSSVISGRSDATLNRGGVRHGTAEVYAIVESLDAVADSLIVHLEDDDGGAGRLLLFVVAAIGGPGRGLAVNDLGVDDALRDDIAAALRSELSPRYVPDEIHAVRVIPRTLSGKKLEVPVKRILQGHPVAIAASTDSMADPTALEPFVALASKLGFA